MITNRHHAKAIRKRGISKQVGHAMEECGEMITALNKYFNRKTIPVEDLVEEIEDVRMFCDQLEFILIEDGHITEEEWEEVKADKEEQFIESLL